jgi:hypothetical protein
MGVEQIPLDSPYFSFSTPKSIYLSMLYVNQRQNSKNKISRLEADENSTPELTRSVTIAIVSSKKQKEVIKRIRERC